MKIAKEKLNSLDLMAIKRERNSTMNEDSASRIARKSFDETLETGAETVRGVQEGRRLLRMCAI